MGAVAEAFLAEDVVRRWNLLPRRLHALRLHALRINIRVAQLDPARVAIGPSAIGPSALLLHTPRHRRVHAMALARDLQRPAHAVNAIKAERERRALCELERAEEAYGGEHGRAAGPRREHAQRPHQVGARGHQRRPRGHVLLELPPLAALTLGGAAAERERVGLGAAEACARAEARRARAPPQLAALELAVLELAHEPFVGRNHARIRRVRQPVDISDERRPIPAAWRVEDHPQHAEPALNGEEALARER